MIKLPFRRSALSLLMLAGSTVLTADASAQNVIPPAPAGEPVDAPKPPATATAEKTAEAEVTHSDKGGRHLAPHGTFFMLSYVAAKTDKGVEGFTPGQEVQFVEAHRPTHTLVVTDGHAQVEVPPSKLTNDIDIAALVRTNDQAGQAKVAAYVQQEQADYDKYEQQAADSTAKDLEHRQQEQKEEVRQVEQAQAAAATPQATPVNTAADYNGGYYGNGGYGYGNPYSYFGGGGTVIAAPNQGTATAAGAGQPAAVAPAAPPSKVAAPPGGGAVGRPR